MSGGNDNVFARWSRRKLSVRSEEQAADSDNPPPAMGIEDADAAPQAATEEPEAAEIETDEPLPRLEDLTAESDLTAFLKKGVPMALKSAAMRKMWSLDPGIRDYVGPSEYAWDFNQPGSMAGFGPLKAKETVVDFLSKVIGDEPPEPDRETSEAPAQVVDDLPKQDADAPAEEGADTASETTSGEPAQAAPANSDPLAPLPVEAAAEPAGAAQPASTRPRHGGAMPR